MIDIDAAGVTSIMLSPGGDANKYITTRRTFTSGMNRRKRGPRSLFERREFGHAQVGAAARDQLQLLDRAGRIRRAFIRTAISSIRHSIDLTWYETPPIILP